MRPAEPVALERQAWSGQANLNLDVIQLGSQDLLKIRNSGARVAADGSFYEIGLPKKQEPNRVKEVVIGQTLSSSGWLRS